MKYAKSTNDGLGRRAGSPCRYREPALRIGMRSLQERARMLERGGFFNQP
jgi:hypothetical protein